MERIVTNQFIYLALIWQGVQTQTQIKQPNLYVKLLCCVKSLPSSFLRKSAATSQHVFVRGCQHEFKYLEIKAQ